MSTDAAYRQRIDALALANERRGRRAHLKIEMKDKKVDGIPVLFEPPEWLETMQILSFLVAIPKIGRSKAGVMLRQCGITPSTHIVNLTHRQRLALQESLEKYRLRQ